MFLFSQNPILTACLRCGWHNDHGSLTGLAPAMYTSAEGEHDVRPAGVADLGVERFGIEAPTPIFQPNESKL